MRYKPLPIGVDNFEKIIVKGSYYVDKTLLIKDLLDNNAEVTLFTRPRRFGKTLNLSMLKYFFEDTRDEERNQKNKELFCGLEIMEAGEAYTAQMCQYPVIFLTLKSAKQPSFEMSYQSLIEDITREFQRYRFILESEDLSEEDKEKYRRIMRQEGVSIEYARAIEFLCRCILNATGKKTIILIDEYDVPLENAYYSGFYDEMIGFIRSLFESALKTNSNLEFAVITGCLRISKESIFTGLNNLNVVSIRNELYSEYFGFTQEETETMLSYYDRKEYMETVREWYDGYLFGETEVYNPWSLLQYTSKLISSSPKNRIPEPYWSNTSSNSVVRDLIRRADSVTKAELEELMAGKTIEKPVHEDITYGDIYRTQDNLWNFLFFTGYLKKISESFRDSEIWMELAIPNTEVKLIYQNQIQSWFQDEMKQQDFSSLYQALLSADALALQQEIMKVLPTTISYMDSKEAFYHGFLFGVLMNLEEGYRKKSNRESGDGRYDICIYHYDETKPAAVVELKVAKRAQELEQCAEEAVKQIEEKKYDMELLDEGYIECLHIGIAFYRKKCRVKIKKAQIKE